MPRIPVSVQTVFQTFSTQVSSDTAQLVSHNASSSCLGTERDSVLKTDAVLKVRSHKTL